MATIHNIEGVELSSASSNSRYGTRDDSVVIKLQDKAKISCKFTSNAFQAAPVIIAKKHLLNGSNKEKILLINAGNANAGNGKSGEQDALKCCKELSEFADLNTEDVLPFSTGVIGEPLSTEQHITAFKKAYSSLKPSNWRKVAKAILTTDTKIKLISKTLVKGKKSINITGFAKGSGMIRPDFATLLNFVFTDADINQSLLDKLHNEALSESFERITVDGDTSPNDSSVLVATGKSGIKLRSKSKEMKSFKKELVKLFQSLAQDIIKDAEGAKKEIVINVEKAKNRTVAREVAFTIAQSPLVKTAMYGNDANWGRILAAVGRADGISDISKVSIKLNGTPLVTRGSRDPKHNESKASKSVKSKKIVIRVILNEGKDSFTVLTSDLSEDYVLINSDYRS
ncbi:MAG: bifunctional glutamate N-acetyltransferase/amino-acid acetyltransferase ArgJ [SAR86 cluster bacterium]|nr:bifunctional glutamate N-acetyltransferase/amino-acid acetyltransferase ArgJ [SAR86 cluster bacterium]